MGGAFTEPPGFGFVANGVIDFLEQKRTPRLIWCHICIKFLKDHNIIDGDLKTNEAYG